MTRRDSAKFATGELQRIGWIERIDLPEWGITELSAKIDTGARSSALHVDSIEEVAENRIAFDVVLDRKQPRQRVRVEADVVRRGRVRASSGQYTRRYFVRTLLRVGSTSKTIEISLVAREKMIYRMLLGRTALAGSFLVDAARRHILTPRRRPKTDA